MTWDLAAAIATLWFSTSLLLGMALGRYIRLANEMDASFWRTYEADATALPAWSRERVPALTLTAAR